MRSIPATPDTPRRRRTRRALGSAAAASVLLVGVAACAGESDDDAGVTTGGSAEAGGSTGAGGAGAAAGRFEATAAYLQQSAVQSEAEGYRVEMLFSMTGEVDEGADPLMSGEVDGDDYHYVMDMGVMMEEMSEGMGGMPSGAGSLDMTMEMAGDLESFYLRAPMLAEMGPALGPEAGGLAEMGDGWGYVDLTEMGDLLPADLASAIGTQGIDPRAVVDMIEGTDQVEDLGTSEVRGDAVHGLSTEISMTDLLEASGQDPEALAELGSQGTSTEDAVTEMYDTPTTIEIWIDDDGYLRRFEFGWEMADLASAMGADPDDLSGLGFGGFRYVMDMYDYGATVDFEPPADAVDITDAYAALAQG
jgi:hypothetical protein